MIEGINCEWKSSKSMFSVEIQEKNIICQSQSQELTMSNPLVG